MIYLNRTDKLREVAIMTTTDKNMEKLLDVLHTGGYITVETDSSRYNNRHFYIANKVEEQEDEDDET